MHATAQEGLPAYRLAITAYVAFIAGLKRRHGENFSPLFLDPPELSQLHELNGRVKGMELALGLTEVESDEIGVPLGMESNDAYKARIARRNSDDENADPAVLDASGSARVVP